MSVSLLFLLALTAVDAKPKPKTELVKTKVLGSGPKEVCEIPANFVRQERSDPSYVVRHWEDISGPLTVEEPKLKKIFYINLDKSPARRNETEAACAEKFPGVPLERWVATNKGAAGNELKTNPVYKKKGKMGGTGIGSIATWFSHYSLIKHISEQEDPNAVYFILEDDVMMTRQNLQHDIMCQIKQLPADWDIFKFGFWGYRMSVAQSKIGYPACGGDQLNVYTCRQHGFQWNYMGNQGYALRPGGAKAMAKKLEETVFMDVDGAMMPGGKKSYYSHPNTYVSKHTLIQHGWKHTSTRTDKGEARSFHVKSIQDELPLTSEEEAKVERIEKEDIATEDDLDGRETSGQQFRRLMAWKENVLDKYVVV